MNEPGGRGRGEGEGGSGAGAGAGGGDEGDDFEESLVRAVLAEHPPEERGVRDEWERRTGWHRREDVRLRRRREASDGDGRASPAARRIVEDAISESDRPLPAESKARGPHRDGSDAWVILYKLMIAALVVVLYLRLIWGRPGGTCARARRKGGRKGEEYVV